ncbi:MAG: GntR family transcriptional regulator [Thermoanaerobaculaceae bacterium]|jgi:DNA-binding GntR family transcriptional regulator|nr:GntR family transcriptional regulator [Thermoanaerobaculaceae bacterium]
MPRSGSLRQQVYEFLKAELGAGRLAPGSWLDLGALETRLGTSRTPLRDALLQLEWEGFVTIRPRRGILVKPLGLDDIRHLYEIIGALESAAILSGAPRLSSRAVARMRALNEAMKAALVADDFGRYYDRNLRFHDVYLDATDNASLQRTVRVLKARLYDFPRRQGFVKEWEVASTGEHDAIVDRLVQGNVQAAAEYVRDVHWSFRVQEPFIHRYYFAREAAGG